MNELILQIPRYKQAATSPASRAALQRPIPRIPAIEILIDDDVSDGQRDVRLKSEGGIWL